MHFGRVGPSDTFDPSLPEDTERTARLLKLPRSGKIEFYVGCPIWACQSWVGSLYPPKTNSQKFLSEYAKHFNSVEVNSTFYHLLEKERLAQWAGQVPDGFHFCPKVYRGITEQLDSSHMPQLVGRFCKALGGFGKKLGLVFAQLSENIGPQQGSLVAKFVECWPSDIPLAIEFRHPGWFRGHSLPDEVINFLYRHHVATVITDTPGRRDVLHLSLTQARVLIRFQGNENPPLDQTRLEQWAKRLLAWSDHHLERVYFFCHQPTEKLIPESTNFLQHALGKPANTGIRSFVAQAPFGQQMSLFS